MEKPTSKKEILADIRRERLLFEKLLNRLSEMQMLTAGVTGQWSVKDILAHIIAWEKVLLDRMNGVLTGQPLKYPPIMNNKDVDLFNEQVFLENRARPLAEVQVEFRATYAELMAELEALGEAFLNNPVPWDWASDDLLLWHIVIANTVDHYQEHRMEIEKFFS